MKQSITTLYVGLDVHKESISVAYAPDARDAEIISPGTIGTRRCRLHLGHRQANTIGRMTMAAT